MINTNTLLIGVMQLLSQSAEFANVEFRTAYTPYDVPIPLKKTYATVMIGSIDIDNSYYPTPDASQPSRAVTLELLFRLHTTDTQSPVGIHEYFMAIASTLSGGLDYDVVKSSCGEVKHNRYTNSYVLTASVTLFYTESPA